MLIYYTCLYHVEKLRHAVEIALLKIPLGLNVQFYFSLLRERGTFTSRGHLSELFVAYDVK